MKPPSDDSFQMGQFIHMKCPVCGKNGIVQNQSTLEIPHFGELFISTLICSDCGYRHTDVMPTGKREPSRYTYRFRDEKGLSVRIVRSGSSTVKIPELGVSIDPGVAGEGYVTNIEGLLERILGIIEHMDKDLKRKIDRGSGDLSNVKERIENVGSMESRIYEHMNGEGSFTLIIEDPYGNSAIISERDDVQIDSLSEEEIFSLLEG